MNLLVNWFVQFFNESTTTYRETLFHQKCTRASLHKIDKQEVISQTWHDRKRGFVIDFSREFTSSLTIVNYC